MESQRQTRSRNKSILNYFQKIKQDLQESESDFSEEIIRKRKRKNDSDSDFTLNITKEDQELSSNDSEQIIKKRKKIKTTKNGTNPKSAS